MGEGFGENLDHHGGSVLPSRTPEPALFLNTSNGIFWSDAGVLYVTYPVW